MSKRNNSNIRKKNHNLLLSKEQPRNVRGKNAWEEWIKRAIGYLTLAALAVPFISLDIFLYPSVFTKITLFYFLIELLLAFYLVLVFLNRNYLPKFSYITTEGKVKSDWIFISVTAYVAIVFLTDLFSINFQQSFWGSLAFANGFLAIAHFYVLYIVAANVLREETFWRKFLKMSVVCGALISFFAIYQWISTSHPAMGTLGNPGYLAGYLVFIFFQSVVLFLWEKEQRWRKVSSVAFLSSAFVILFCTDIRSAVLGVVVGILAGVALFFLSHKEKTVRKAASTVVLAALLLSIVFSAYYIKSEKIYTLFKRSQTVKTRLIAWRAGTEGFLERPLTGFGLENYPVVFEKYFDPAFVNQGDGTAGTDSGSNLPHNKLIEVAVSNGILALLAYLGIFAAVFWKLFLNYRKKKEKIYLALGGLFAGYLMHLMFLFDNPATFAFFYLALAFLVVLDKGPEPVLEKEGNRDPNAVYVFSGIVFVLFISAFYSFGIKPMVANYDGAQMYGLAEAGKFDEAGGYLARMEQKNLFYVNDAAMIGAVNYYQLSTTDKGNFSPDKIVFLKKVIGEQEAVVQRNPLIFNYAIKLGLLYDLAGANDKSYYDKTVKLLEGVIGQGTKRVDAYYILAGAYGQLGNAEKVAALTKEGIALDPTYGYASYLFGGVYYDMKDFSDAARYFQESIDKKYANADSYKMLADAYIGMNDFPHAISAYEQLVRLKPNDAQLEANLLMLYINGNQPDKARAKGNEIKQNYPKTVNQIDQLLSKLPK